MLSFGTAPLVGLDIGSATVKAVGLRKKNDRLLVERAAIAAMPDGAVSGGVFTDPPAVAECIRRLCRDHGLRGKQVAVGLAGEDVFLTRLKLERNSKTTIEAQVREEAARVAPFPLDQAPLDFQVLETFSDSQWVDVLVVAAKPGKIERLQAVLQRAGKTPVVVDSAACALANAYELNYEPAPADLVTLLHLGAAGMTVCIVRGATPVLAKDLPLSGIQQASEELTLTDRIGIHLEKVFEQMDEIADERPLEPRSSQIQKLLLSGGGARLKGLAPMLKSRIRLPFEEMNPFRKIEFESPEALSLLVWDEAHAMPVAVGLALRGFDAAP
ncbi:MAG: pilus assembly protein PilM [Acidobacteria bacterium]|nr:pilus assembly protein PilM [Acidobacteriota bacterium]